MTNWFGLKPPSSVPGPVRESHQPPPVTGTSRPAPYRRVTVDRFDARTQTLSGIAEMVYGSARRWTDIFNTNRDGVVRPDRSSGFITDPNAMLSEGLDIIVPL